MKTAEQIYNENGFTEGMRLPFHLVEMLMKKYASQALDEAALKTTDVELSKQIYAIKSELK